MKSFYLLLILNMMTHTMNRTEILSQINVYIEKTDKQSVTEVLNSVFRIFVAHPLYFTYNKDLEKFLTEKRDRLIDDIHLNESLADATQSLIDLTAPQPNFKTLHAGYLKKLDDIKLKNMKNAKQQLMCDNFLFFIRINKFKNNQQKP